MRLPLLFASVLLVSAHQASAIPTYWNVFNIEGESSIGAAFVTYETLSDMLTDANRVDVIIPSAGASEANVVGTGADGTYFWNLFNIEGEASIGAAFATYATLSDMLLDTNRLDVVIPDRSASEANIIGTGSDGSTWWNLFNIEGEASIGAAFATYASLSDMLLDTNRLDVVIPDRGASEANVIGTGSDGSTWWNLFNIEGEASIGAAFATYATLSDMLLDTNRLDVVIPDRGASEANVIGTGAIPRRRSPPVDPVPVAEPSTLALLCLGSFALLRRRRQL